jgi:hypothetical protein
MSPFLMVFIYLAAWIIGAVLICFTDVIISQIIGCLLIFFGIGFLLLVPQHDSRTPNALRDLRAEGWHVTKDNINGDVNRVTFDCATFRLKKLNGKYFVVEKREKLGGYKLLHSENQQYIRKVCE